jgi:hypothetical protein
MKNTENLTIEAVESCSEIQSWLAQFPDKYYGTAKDFLLQLNFVSRDTYAKWLQNKLDHYAGNECALYAVRKFRSTAKSAWSKSGTMNKATTTTLGSEDLVRSVISHCVRKHEGIHFDHPSVYALKKNKIKNIILIDDSLGSGDQVANYVRLFLSHPSIRSWWSFGWIRIIVISYARTENAKQTVLNSLPGSNHSTKKFPAYSKITFDCDNVYEAGASQRRWGPKHEHIINLCRQTKTISPDRRMGYGSVMGNLIFYHSVPNNVPGILYSKKNGWKPLFPDRLVPTWLNDLLVSPPSPTQLDKVNLPLEAYDVLLLLKKGLKTRSALARRLEVDIKIIHQTIKACISNGLITDSMRLTHEGAVFLKKQKPQLHKDFTPNYSMYIPKSWCTGHNPPSRPSDESSELSEGGDF